ncbi:HVO_A0556 family zinc finger protein [Natrinema soli]|uniref:HVO_A0556 family zinc finger protein n=2 Tax=Natrinema soli TaxID=1930624 RepID=A0ABD5SZI8_9EURY
MEDIRSDGETLLSRLEGNSCPQCTAGTLERGTYKDNVAVVCPACETPQVQLWDVGSH